MGKSIRSELNSLLSSKRFLLAFLDDNRASHARRIRKELIQLLVKATDADLKSIAKGYEDAKDTFKTLKFLRRESRKKFKNKRCW